MDGTELFHGPNAGYALELYDQYVRDPESLDPQTRALFDLLPASAFFDGATAPPAGTTVPGAVVAVGATTGAGTPGAVVTATPIAAAPAAAPGIGIDTTTVSRVAELARHIRGRGHLAAHLDPLGMERPGDPGLDLHTYGLSEADLAALPAAVVGGTAAEGAPNALVAIERLRQIYQGATGYDFSHVQDAKERRWLREAVESGDFHAPLSTAEKRSLLERLTRVEALERFLHQVYRDQKRFSIEGTDLLVPMLDEVIRAAVDAGTREVVMGMAHRGRLNVLAHVLHKPYAQMLAEFREAALGAGPAPTEGINTGRSDDVKYHLGATAPWREGTAVSVTLTLASNPSHLEFIGPVIEGMARAAQDCRDAAGPPRQDGTVALPILIHGDAAFPGEGVVAETLNLSRLPGYRTGGTIHIITNNGLGFTTEPKAARSTLYASDLAKGFEIPIIHVNADDAPACIAAARLAHAYRTRFQRDVLIDLIGYRRWGHNEGDEPAYTQPLLYEQIGAHPTVRALWAQQLDREELVSLDESDAMLDAAVAELREINRASAAPDASGVIAASGAAATPTGLDEETLAAVATAVPAEQLTAYNEALLRYSDGFAVHQRLARQLERRRDALAPDGTIDWALAETLAFASILADGTPIRLTGQDSERGTFSQRHLVLHDVTTGGTYTPLQMLPQARAAFAVYNSPLSEAGALGFEYGYSVHAAETLVLWEAQYGDFANAAQVVIDQFIASARAKWQQRPALVLLLPHGYEGQGPEHSSARLERYLQLAARDNMWVTNPTTAAQYFHLLRRQAALLRTDPRPLVVMTPKSLLRHVRAASCLDDLTAGTFQPVLDDPAAAGRDDVSRLVLCSGKVYVDLAGSDERAATPSVAIARVEQLYPFPSMALERLIGAYQGLREVVWVQEEPQNMGAWSYIAPRLRALLDPRGLPLSYTGRTERASPAVGSARAHLAEQARIVAETFAGVRALQRT